MPALAALSTRGDADTYRHQVPPVWAERCGEGSLNRLIQLVGGGHGVVVERIMLTHRSFATGLEAPVREWELDDRAEKAKVSVGWGHTCDHWTIPIPT